MRGIGKKIFSVALAVTVASTVVPANSYFSNAKNVKATTNYVAFSDDYVVDRQVMPDTNLLKAVKKIVGGSETASVTMAQIKAYTGVVNLSNYPEISDLTGLGFMRNASEIDASQLTRLKKIENNEFQLCSFDTFRLGPNVKEIGKQAFFQCSKLTTIEFPSNLEVIGIQAFQDCTLLDNIVFPANIKRIGDNAFSGCETLKKIVIPDGINATVEKPGEEELEGMGANVFSNCSSLSDVKIGSGMTVIPTGTFNGCGELTEIDIPSRVINIRSAAFEATPLRKIDLSKNTGMTVISTNTFNNCQLLDNVKLPSSIVEIGESAFAYTKSLNDDIFEGLDNLKKIDQNAFLGSGLNEIILPKNLESIGESAFAANATLTDVTFEDFDSVGTSGVKKIIGKNAFANDKFLANVKLPSKNQYKENESIEIEEKAFTGCYNLENINFPADLTKIGDYAFEKCGRNVTDYSNGEDEFSGELTGGYTWLYPEKIIKVDGPGEGISQICCSTIEEYVDLTYANIKNAGAVENAPGAVPFKYVDSDPTKKAEIHTQHITGIKRADLSKCTRLAMGIGVFQECYNLSEALLPDNMLTIPDYTFKNCYAKKFMPYNGGAVQENSVSARFDKWAAGGLRKIQMSPNVKIIGRSAFEGCEYLNLENGLPKKIEEIKPSAFRRCRDLSHSIVIPTTLKYIGNYAFADTSRIYNGKKMDKKYGIVKCDAGGAINLQYIENNAFENSAIDNFIMNEEAPLRIVGNNAFRNCQYLASLKVSKNTKYIRGGAVTCCFRLKSLNIPDICTLDNDVCKGYLRDDFELKDDGESTVFYIASENGIDYYTTYKFDLTITPVDAKLAIRENNSTILPLATITTASSNSSYSDINIDDLRYTWDSANKWYTGEEINTFIYPSYDENYAKVEKTDYSGELTPKVKRISMEGRITKTDIPVIIHEELRLPCSDKSVMLFTPAVTYTADVTKNPCVEIKTDDSYNLPYDDTRTKRDIKPVFVPQFNDSETTDKANWKIESGEDILNLEVAADGKTAKINLKQAKPGVAKILITAGTVSKTIYVYASAPANKVNLNTYNTDLFMGTTSSLEASLLYRDSDVSSGYSVRYPDAIKFTSTNEDIVKVGKVQNEDGKSTCVMIPVKEGKAEIWATSIAGNYIAKCKINVTADGVKPSLKDSLNNPINENDIITCINKESTAIFYDFNKELSNKNIKVDIENENILNCYPSSDWNGNRIKLVGKMFGTTKITVYPEVGSAAKNGITRTVSVTADISEINLARRTIPVGQTISVFTLMKNTFGNEITEATDYAYSRITDNKIEFVSSNPSAATVDRFGNVTAKSIPADGQVNITVNTYRNSVKTCGRSVTVTIEKAKNGGGSGQGNGQGQGQGLSSDYIVGPDGVKTYAPIKAKIKKLKRGKKKIKITWKKLYGASGYQIKMAKKKKKKFKLIKTITSGNKTSFVKKKLKRKRRYYFKVRGYAKNAYGQKIYGKWSAVKGTKAK